MKEKTIKERLMDRARQEPEGFTLGAENVRKGYIVGGILSIVIDSWDEIDDWELAEFYNEYEILADTRPLVTFGYWRDPETQRIYLDIGDIWYDRKAAALVAYERGEIAVWDQVNEERIRTKALL